MLAGIAAAAVLLWLPAMCAGFGEDGHKGFYNAAFRLLRADEKGACALAWPDYRTGRRSVPWTVWRGESAVYPDGIVVYFSEKPSLHQLGVEAIIAAYEQLTDSKIDEGIRDLLIATVDPGTSAANYLLNFQNSLNSADHYYNPNERKTTAPTFRTDAKFRKGVASVLASAVVEAFFQIVPVPDALRATIEPKLHAGVSQAVITELEKNDSIFNGTARSFSEYLDGDRGAVPVSGADGTGYNAVTAATFYLGFGGKDNGAGPSKLSPHAGFVTLARQAKNAGDSRFVEALVSLGAASHYIADLHAAGHTEWGSWYIYAHTAYDGYGDEFLRSVSLAGMQPLPLLQFDGNDGDPSDKLVDAATSSRQYWDNRGSDWTPSHPVAMQDHMKQGVALMAGVIDRAFSSVANPDAPYKRDATGFLGMAVALSAAKTPGAVISPDRLAGGKCSLGGVDQDDFFPVTGNWYRVIEISVSQGDAAKVHAEVRGPDGNHLVTGVASGGRIKITLAGQPPADLILRVWCEDGSAVEYSIAFSDQTQPSGQGMLDVVVCIDRSGSMMDDIQAIKDASDATLADLDSLAKSNNFTLAVGLVLYTRHDEPGWIQVNILSPDIAAVRRNIQAIQITDPSLGKGGNEDIFGALMFAMNQTVGGQSLVKVGNDRGMGWRQGAAKIIIPIGDEPPDDPDWEGRTLDQVSKVAEALDPVHVYPLLVPKPGSGFQPATVAGMQRVAGATGGQVIRVSSARLLPAEIVGTVKLAVRRHREEVWRKMHPPYGLYATAAGMGLLVLVALALAGLSIRRRHQRLCAVAAQVHIDPLLTGGLPWKTGRGNNTRR